jgi:hypothetical protein
VVKSYYGHSYLEENIAIMVIVNKYIWDLGEADTKNVTVECVYVCILSFCIFFDKSLAS